MTTEHTGLPTLEAGEANPEATVTRGFQLLDLIQAHADINMAFDADVELTDESARTTSLAVTDTGNLLTAQRAIVYPITARGIRAITNDTDHELAIRYVTGDHVTVSAGLTKFVVLTGSRIVSS